MGIYLQVAVCFAAIGLSAFLAEKTKLFFAPFYILAGFLLGPGGLNWVTETEVITLLGEIGVVFLLFFLGLEFSLHNLLEKKKTIMTTGLIDFLINFGLGFGLGMLLGLNVLESLAIAGAVYMSSSGIITKSLLELRVQKQPEGQMIMGIMIFEDLVMILFLAIISSGFSLGGQMNWAEVIFELGKAITYCAAILLFAKYGRGLLGRLLNIYKSELLLLVFFGLVLLITAVGQLFGVSPALSAFFVGMAFSELDNVKKIERQSITFRDLFGSVFYFSFGMALTIGAIAAYWDILLYVAILAIGGKLLSSFIITRLHKCENHMALFIGFITIPRGEFSLVISNLVGSAIPFLGPVMVIIVMLSTLVSSLVLRVSKMMCKIYNICIIYPRTRLNAEDNRWGEVD